MQSDPQKPNTNWLSLSEAADYLGVHFTTLRRWADQGKVAHFRTPGGRRRFALSDLKLFVAQNQQGKEARGPVFRENTLVRMDNFSARLDLEQQRWMDKIGDLDRIKLKGVGQMMMGLLMQYTARSENNHLYLSEAQNIAQEMGAICARVGMTAKEVVCAFLLFRSSILEMLMNTSAVNQPLDEEGKLLHRRANEYMDALLLAIIDGYSTPIK